MLPKEIRHLMQPLWIKDCLVYTNGIFTQVLTPVLRDKNNRYPSTYPRNGDYIKVITSKS